MAFKTKYLIHLLVLFLLASPFLSYSQNYFRAKPKEYTIKYNLKLLKKNSDNKKTDEVLYKISEVFLYFDLENKQERDSVELVIDYLSSKKKKLSKRPLYWSILSDYEKEKNNSFGALKHYLKYCDLFKPYKPQKNNLLFEKPTEDVFPPSFKIEGNFLDVLKEFNSSQKKTLFDYINSFSENKKSFIRSHSYAQLLLSMLQFDRKEFLKSFESYLNVNRGDITVSSYDSPQNNCHEFYSSSDSYKHLVSIVAANNYDQAMKLLKEKNNSSKKTIVSLDIQYHMFLCKKDYDNAVESFVNASVHIPNEANFIGSNYFFNNNNFDFKKLIPEIKNKTLVKKQLKRLIGHENINFSQKYDLAEMFFANSDYQIAYDLVIKNMNGENNFGALDSPFELFLEIPDNQIALKYIDKFLVDVPRKKRPIQGVVDAYISLNAIEKIPTAVENYFDLSLENIVPFLSGILYDVEFSPKNKVILHNLLNKLLKKYPQYKEELQASKNYYIERVNYYTKLNTLLTSASLLKKGEFVSNKNYEHYLRRVLSSKPNKFTLGVLKEYSFLYKRYLNGSQAQNSFHYINHYRKHFTEKEVLLFFDYVRSIASDSRDKLEDIIFFKPILFPNKIEIELIEEKIASVLKLPIDERIQELEKMRKQYTFSSLVRKVLVETYIYNKRGMYIKKGVINQEIWRTIDEWQYIDSYDPNSYYLDALRNYKELFVTTETKNHFATDVTNKEGSAFKDRYPYTNFINEFEKALKVDSSFLSKYDFSKIIEEDEKAKALVEKYKK